MGGRVGLIVERFGVFGVGKIEKDLVVGAVKGLG